MKILHIGDIHLGCKYNSQTRNDEIKKVFDFLVQKVSDEKVEAALLAGDVFDNGLPSSESQELYYGFLMDLLLNGCRQIIVIAGNHDKPEFLDAPKELLGRLNIHVIGKVNKENLEQEVIALGAAEAPSAFVCAVPQLYVGDVRGAVPEGEDSKTQTQLFAEGVADHYRKVYAIADKLRAGHDIPIIGMGHLYAIGSTFSAKKPQQVVGNLEGVQLEDFGTGFDYMALGHIHKPQAIPGHDNWRYAGSILPMAVQEKMYATQVILLDTKDLSHPKGIELPDECFHKMKYIKGDMEELRAALAELRKTNDLWWVKAVYTGKEIRHNWSCHLQQELRDSNVAIAETDIQRTPVEQEAGAESASLEEKEATLETLTPETVFLKHLAKQGVTDENEKQMYLKCFNEVAQIAYNKSQQQEVASTRRAGLMKFKRLYIKNVNSLYGEHLIDFESPDFNKGIFLISGPTGAGKSSILDAICLALYGETPRIKSISAKQDSVMSEDEDEMKAELTFSLGKDIYRAEFQHARAKGHDPFGQAKHVLVKNSVPQNFTPGQVPKEIGRLIGMDAGQFTRCVLLAQGSFDAFLRSDSKDRAAILTQITGTEIYTQIGAKIYEAFKVRDDKYQLAKSHYDLSKKSLLSEDTLKEYEEKQDIAKAHCDAIQERIDKCKEIEGVFKDIDENEQEVQKAMKDLEQAEKAQKEAEPMQIQLQNAQRAQLCQEAYNALMAKTKELDNAQTKLEDLKKALNDLEKNLKNANTEKDSQAASLGQILEEQTNEQQLFKKVRELDTLIGEKNKQLNTAQVEYDIAITNRKQAEETFKDATQKWKKAQSEAQASTEYLKKHAADEQLEKKQENWKLRCNLVSISEQENTAEEKAIQNEREKLEKAEIDLKKLWRTIEEIEKKQQEQKKKIDLEEEKREELRGGKSDEEIQKARDSAFTLNDFFSSGKKRSDFLQPNQPCPLCGSTHHPYCEGTPVPPDNSYNALLDELEQKIEAIARCKANIEDFEKELRNLEKQFEANKARYDEQSKQYQTNLKDLNEHKSRLKEKQEQANSDAKSLADEFYQALQVDDWTDHSKPPQSLQRRINDYNDAKNKANALENAQKDFKIAETAYNAVKKQNLQTEQLKKKTVDDLKTKLEAFQAKRKELFGNDNVETRENALTQKVKNARMALEKAKDTVTRAQAHVDDNKKQQDEEDKHIQQLTPELKDLKLEFDNQLHNNGLSSKEDFEAKQMKPTEIRVLIDKLTQLNTNVQTAKKVLLTRKNDLEKTKQSLPENTDRTKNLEELNTQDKEHLTAQNEWQKFRDLVRDENKKMDDSKKAKQEMEKLEPDFTRWKFLNDNFGSTGSTDRFGRIAQGYTFRKLLFYANSNRLTSLQRHFTLVNVEQNPLELNVIDHYRFDKIRTSRNLSGGESFEVSLALALGLADMSAISQNASLGNVLLDEGFGTLDEDSLDSALNLLIQLNGSGKKLVGIISHVTKLREKIDAKIEVTNRDGMGAIAGAGVKTLACVRQQWALDHPEEAATIEKARKRDEQKQERDRRRLERAARKAQKEADKTSQLVPPADNDDALLPPS